MDSSRFKRRELLAAGAFMSLGLPAVAAYAWPDRPVKVVVAFPAGGPTDIAARIVAQKLSERLHAPVIVENRPGASGSIGTAWFLKSPADGYTLSMFGMPALLAPILYGNGAYDAARDFLSVASVYDLPMGIMVNPSVLPQVDSVQSLVAHARSAKVPLNYTSPGAGSFGHLAMEQLKDLAGFDMQHVPYKGSAPAMVDLLGGQIGVMFADLLAGLPSIKAGKLRAIAVSSPRAKVLLPGAKTVSEQGFPGFDFDSWGGMIAPPGTPLPIVERINRELADLLANDPETRSKLLGVGAIAAYEPGPAMHQRLARDQARWSKVARDKGIKVV